MTKAPIKKRSKIAGTNANITKGRQEEIKKYLQCIRTFETFMEDRNEVCPIENLFQQTFLNFSDLQSKSTDWFLYDGNIGR